MGDPKPGDSFKSIWIPRVGGWAQGASAGTKAPDSCRAQAEEKESALVPSCWLPKLSTKKNSHNLKAERVLFGENVMTSSLEGSVSGSPEKLLQGAGGKESGYIEVYNKVEQAV